mgnify:CR=1 FL=1
MNEQDSRYLQLLDRAFASLPSAAASASTDFVVPTVDSLIQGSKTLIRNFSQIAGIARRKPDTHIEETEHGYEVIVCEACGARYTVKEE